MLQIRCNKKAPYLPNSPFQVLRDMQINLRIVSTNSCPGTGRPHGSVVISWHRLPTSLLSPNAGRENPPSKSSRPA